MTSTLWKVGERTCRIPVINTSHLDRIDELLVDNIDTGEFKLHRSVLLMKPYLTSK